MTYLLTPRDLFFDLDLDIEKMIMYAKFVEDWAKTEASSVETVLKDGNCHRYCARRLLFLPRPSGPRGQGAKILSLCTNDAHKLPTHQIWL